MKVIVVSVLFYCLLASSIPVSQANIVLDCATKTSKVVEYMATIATDYKKVDIEKMTRDALALYPFVVSAAESCEDVWIDDIIEFMNDTTVDDFKQVYADYYPLTRELIQFDKDCDYNQSALMEDALRVYNTSVIFNTDGMKAVYQLLDYPIKYIPSEGCDDHSDTLYNRYQVLMYTIGSQDYVKILEATASLLDEVSPFLTACTNVQKSEKISPNLSHRQWFKPAFQPLKKLLRTSDQNKNYFESCVSNIGLTVKQLGQVADDIQAGKTDAIVPDAKAARDYFYTASSTCSFVNPMDIVPYMNQTTYNEFKKVWDLGANILDNAENYANDAGVNNTEGVKRDTIAILQDYIKFIPAMTNFVQDAETNFFNDAQTVDCINRAMIILQTVDAAMNNWYSEEYVQCAMNAGEALMKFSQYLGKCSKNSQSNLETKKSLRSVAKAPVAMTS